ncbi:DUF4168 domain-containing protein [Sphingobium ummariense]|uniref:DUF4168 domain-containing protein n=1 Tax=Sphingobium ummariense RL-3 TaxID=1346791 RepID=T0K2X8_9SPHN|nr:DUF4168 domain-containing protein [Sphingobium ummariense]EQB30919.1 hypothetical protein M529_16525 [Sphingobium ummariense RL-3]
MTGLKANPFLKYGIAAAALLGAYPAMAQMAPAQSDPAAPAQTAPAPATPATPATPSAGAGNYSDAELKQFADAAVEVTKIQSDSSIAAADKQPKMLAALQAKGMPPEKFNAIGQAAAADPALQQRIQAAASPAPSAAPASPAAPADPATPAQPPQ